MRPGLIAAGLAAAGLVAAALAPWPIGAERAAGLVGVDLARDHGVGFSAAGPATFTLLPVPRLAFAGATLRAADGAVLAETGPLQATLGLGGLLSGRVAVSEVVASGARISPPADLGDDLEPAVLRVLGRLVGEKSRLNRLVLRGAAILSPREVVPGDASARRPHPRIAWERIEALDLVLDRPAWGAAEASGGFTWSGAPVRFALSGLRPPDLVAGRGSPANLDLRWPEGRLSADGALEPARSWRESRWAGTARLETRSVRRDLAWLRLPAALAPLLEGLEVEARAEAGRAGIVLSGVRAKAAGAVLDGAAGIALGEGRLALSGTLATDNLDLGAALAPVVEALAGDGPLGLAEATGGDLDLRLSAGRLAAGPLAFEDVAARLTVREGEVEAMVGRASLKGGTVKGRLALAGGSRGTEVKLQAAFQGVDVGPLLADLGQGRWVQGRAGGQVALESTGATPAALAAGLTGRLALGLDDGELAGISLEEVLRGAGQGHPETRSDSRADSRAEPRADRRLGRTPFERADLVLRFTNGIGEITEASLRAPALLAGLRGQVSVPERSLGARAEVAPREAGAVSALRPALFDVSGPWASPAFASAPADVAAPFAPAPVKRPVPPRASAFAP